MIDRCLHADTNGSGDTNTTSDEESREAVVVSAAALIGWDEYRTRSMQREYRIIQLLKKHRRRSTPARRAGSRASTSAAPQGQDPPPTVHGGMTLEGAREAIVRERCEALRPKASWGQVAESLGITDKTLWTQRREIYDSTHKFHPDQST